MNEDKPIGSDPLKKKPDPSYAPVYCAIYPDLARIAKAYGYALCIHGSLARDMDLVAVPWTDSAQDPELVVKAFLQEFHLRLVGGPPTRKPNGRLVITLSIGHGDCAIDLSFMPILVDWWKIIEKVQAAVDRSEPVTLAMETPEGAGSFSYTPKAETDTTSITVAGTDYPVELKEYR